MAEINNNTEGTKKVVSSVPVNTESITPKSEAPTGEETKKTETTEISSSEDASTEIIKQTEGAIDTAKTEVEGAQERLDEENEAREKEKESAIEDAEESAKTKAKALIKADRDAKKIEEEAQANLDKSKANQEAILKKQRDLYLASSNAEIEFAKNEAELQKSKDAAAILTAKTEIEKERQQSAWAFEKLGLGVSSGIVLESQRIATEGITDIATLKVEASSNQAKSTLAISKLQTNISKTQLNYNTNLNLLIDGYRDKSLSLKKTAIDRINELSFKKISLVEDLEAKKLSIIKETKAEAKADKEKFIADQKELANTIQKNTITLRKEFEAQEAINKTKASTVIQSGKYSSLSTLEKQELAFNAGMSVDELNFANTNAIQKGVYSETARALGNSYLISQDDLNVITDKVGQLTRAGKSLAVATTSAVKDVLGAEITASKTSGGAATSKDKFKTVVGADGTLKRINITQGTSTDVVEIGTKDKTVKEKLQPASGNFFNPEVEKTVSTKEIVPVKVNTSPNIRANEDDDEETNSSGFNF